MKKLVLFCLCISLVACEDDDNGLLINTGTNSYLPLQVGNEWKFVSTNGDTGEQYTFKRVISMFTINNHEYAGVISGHSIATEITHDTSYYRIDDRGFVYVIRQGDTMEENLYRLNGGDGESWTYETEYDNTVSIELTVTPIELDGKNLNNCKAYYYDVDTMVDEEYTTTLGKDIGFVKLYSNGWGNGEILKSAIINGHQLNF